MTDIHVFHFASLFLIIFDSNRNKHGKYLLYITGFTTHYLYKKIFEEDKIIISILKIRKLRHREILYAQDQITSKTKS